MGMSMLDTGLGDGYMWLCLGTVDAKTAFYGQTFTFYIIWHHHAGPGGGVGGCEADRVPVIIKLIGDVIDLYECGHIVCRVRAAPAVTCRQGNINPGNRHLSWVCVCINFTTTQQDCFKTHDNRLSPSATEVIILLDSWIAIMFGEWQHQPGIIL